MQNYKCSVCGWEVVMTCLTSLPPITEYKCVKCWLQKQLRPEPVEPLVIDMTENAFYWESISEIVNAHNRAIDEMDRLCAENISFGNITADIDTYNRVVRNNKNDNWFNLTINL